MNSLKGESAPWVLFSGWVIAGSVAGVVFGAVRGLDYLPTLPFALLEGGIIFGIPAGVIGLVLVGLWYAGRTLVRVVCRHSSVAGTG